MLARVTENIKLDKPLGSVILCGDPGCDGYNVEAVVVLEHLLRMPTDIHLVLGDLVPTGKEQWFEQFKRMVQRNAVAPVYCIPGNHDLPEYSDYCGLRDYCIEAPNALFIMLDNSRRYFSPDTFEFLRKSLEETATDNVFITFHIPPPNPFIPNNFSQDQWEMLREIMQPHQHRIRLLFCGHVHSAFDYKLEGFRIIVTGGAGSRLDPIENTCLHNSGHHAFKLKFNGNDWTVSIVDVDHDEASQVYTPDNSHTPDNKILQDLNDGFAAEAQAARKYELYAQMAESEGYPNLARLLLAASESEQHHSRNMFLATNERRSILHNLKSAIDREHEESCTLYPAAVKTSAAHNSLRAENAYNCALHAEKVHYRLLSQALDFISQGKDIPHTKYFTCQRCGYTHAGDKPPAICPACGTDRFKFKEAA